MLNCARPKSFHHLQKLEEFVAVNGDQIFCAIVSNPIELKYIKGLLDQNSFVVQLGSLLEMGATEMARAGARITTR